MKKRLLSVLLASVLSMTTVAPVLADEEADVRAEIDADQAALSNTQAALDALAVKREDIQAQISDMNADLVDLMLQIDDTQSDIDTTQGKITDTQTKIDETSRQLSQAEAKRDEQYEAMKKRIQYIYENGGDVGLAITVLESNDVTQFFNKTEYTEQIASTDRDQLNSLKETVSQVQTLKGQLESQKSDLVSASLLRMARRMVQVLS